MCVGGGGGSAVPEELGCSCIALLQIWAMLPCAALASCEHHPGPWDKDSGSEGAPKAPCCKVFSMPLLTCSGLYCLLVFTASFSSTVFYLCVLSSQEKNLTSLLQQVKLS